ncbi:MAG: hypothetical protein U0821_26545 [Chloroflexota bacterium]
MNPKEPGELAKGQLELVRLGLVPLVLDHGDQHAFLEQFFSQALDDEDSADELALQFDDVIGLVPQLVDQGMLSPEFATVAAAIDRRLDEMSHRSDKSVWTIGALGGEDWRIVRELARRAMALFPTDAAQPGTGRGLAYRQLVRGRGHARQQTEAQERGPG